MNRPDRKQRSTRLDTWSPGRVAVYYRTSSDEQEEMGTIETQQREVMKHLSRLGISPVLEFADDGVTGVSEITDRPQGRLLIRAAQRGEFDTLYVYKISRLGREAYYILHADHLLRQAGIHLQSVTEPFDPVTSSGRFLVTLWAGNAGLERDNIVQQTSAGTERCLDEGYWMGGRVPMGYKRVPDGKRKRIAVCDDEIRGPNDREPRHPDWTPAKIVRYIWNRTLLDRATAGVIGAELGALGLPTCWVPGDIRYGEPQYGLWSAVRVANILHSRTYMGQHVYGKDRRTTRRAEPVVRPCPAFVTEEEWLMAQQILKGNRTLSKKNSKRFYLLRGVIKCGAPGCGCTFGGTNGMNGRTSKKSATYEGIRYYRCGSQCRSINGLPASGRCRSQYLRAEEVEAIVRQDLKEILTNPGEVLDKLREKMGETVELSEDYLTEIEGLEAQRRALDSQEMEYLRLRVAGHIDSDAKLALLQGELRDKASQLSDRSAELRAKMEAAALAEGHLHRAADFLAEIGNVIPEEDDHAAWRHLVELLVIGITVYTDHDVRPKRARLVIDYRVGRPGSMSQLFPLPRAVTLSTATFWAGTPRLLAA